MEKGSGTQSSLLWEVERLLLECKEKNQLPQVLVMENVPQVIQAKGWREWNAFLESLGYSNYCEVLNAKNFEIPQNRQRAFMVSILGDYNYTFPKNIGLKYRLKDFLEHNVEEKYYLSKKMIEGMQKTKYESYKLENKLLDKNECASTILARFEGTPQLVYDNGCKPFENHEGGVVIPNATKKGYLIAKEGDGIDIGGRMFYHRGNVQEGMAQTIKTQCEIGVVVDLKRGYSCEVKQEKTDSKEIDYIGNYSKSGYNQTSIVGKNGITPTITENHGQVTAIVEETMFTDIQKEMITEDGNIKRYIGSQIVDKFNEGDCADISFPNGYNKANRVFEGYAPTINTTTTQFITKENNLRIRKLTCREVFRLMGVPDDRIDKLTVSNAQKYKQAGNSIVTTCLMAIFGKLLGIDYESKIKELVEGIVKNGK